MTSLPRAPSARAWQVSLVFGLCAIGAYFAIPGPLMHSIAYDAIGLIFVAAIVVGIRLNKPADRLTWWLFVLANGLSVVADMIGTWYVAHGADVPVPSIADVFYVGAYIPLFGAVLRLGRRAVDATLYERRTDAAIVSLATLALAWQTIMGSYAHESAVSALGKLTLLAYPIMDVGLLFVVVSTLLFNRTRRPVHTLVLLATLVLVAGDLGYDLLELHNTYLPGNPLDVTWLLNYVLIGVAAMHPSMSHRLLAIPAEPDESLRHPHAWVVGAALAAAAVPAIVVFGSTRDARVLAGIAIPMSLLIALRMSGMVRQLQRQSAELVARTESLQDALFKRDNLEADLRYLAFHDGLTGLANRALLHDRIEHALVSAGRGTQKHVVLLIDLDGFKAVNDSLGHQAGDFLLITFAHRLNSVLRPSDTIARLGGDEFSVLVTLDEDGMEVGPIAARILAELRQPITVGEHAISLTASIGVALADSDSTPEQLLSDSDAAMYAARTRGGDRYELFDAPMRTRAMERLAITTGFLGAIERGEFFCEFQPVFNLSDSTLHGFEALVRWNHPTLGVLPPARFIAIAEETGFIVPLGRWVIDAACAAAATWLPVGHGHPTVAVNLSLRQLEDPDLVADVSESLAAHSLSGERLVLEITESMLAGDTSYTLQVMAQFKRRGIRIAIDDFGTGYSSFGRLRGLPIDILKIDKSFVDHVDRGDDRALIDAIVRLSDELGLDTIAEGIETPDQREVLGALGCAYGQGYLFARPLQEDAAQALVRRYALEAYAARAYDVLHQAVGDTVQS